MSYDIYLNDKNGDPCRLPESIDIRGGTYQIGGTDEAWLNITYNYGPIFRRVLGESGIRSIYGMTGAASIPVLKAAIDKLADDTDPDYWKPTEGNAKAAIMNLIELAQICPDGVWGGD